MRGLSQKLQCVKLLDSRFLLGTPNAAKTIFFGYCTDCANRPPSTSAIVVYSPSITHTFRLHLVDRHLSKSYAPERTDTNAYNCSSTHCTPPMLRCASESLSDCIDVSLPRFVRSIVMRDDLVLPSLSWHSFDGFGFRKIHTLHLSSSCRPHTDLDRTINCKHKFILYTYSTLCILHHTSVMHAELCCTKCSSEIRPLLVILIINQSYTVSASYFSKLILLIRTCYVMCMYFHQRATCSLCSADQYWEMKRKTFTDFSKSVIHISL